MKRDLVYGCLLSLVGTLALMSLRWGLSAQERLILIDERLAKIQQSDRDAAQDKQIRALWRYGGWNEQQIGQLRWKLQMEPAPRPDYE